jgi:hypothetical protein
MTEEIFIPIAGFAAIFGIVWVVQLYAARNRAAFQATVRAAIEKGMELSPDMIRALGGPRAAKHADIRSGLIWTAVAVAFLVSAWVLPSDPEEFDTVAVFSGLAAFPGFIGLALLGYGFAMMRSKDKDK